jgi:hypothetical protein
VGWWQRLRRSDWDAIAGVTAAGVALVLDLLHIVDQQILLPIALVVLALLLIRDLRREERDDRLESALGRTEGMVAGISTAMKPPDAVLIGPRQLRATSEAFARQAMGEMTWFNVCLLMFRPQSLFDSLLRPAIENPRVTGIQFVLDESERKRWDEDVLPKVARCLGAAKVREPQWRALQESVSFILADIGEDGKTEAQLSFWGEPFMARTVGHEIPRYIFHVQSHSELIHRLSEMERMYRSGGP